MRPVMSAENSGRRAWIAAGLVALAVTAMVWMHLAATPPQPHGVHGDEYVEHAHRLVLARAVQEGMWRRPLELLALADGDYPPGIHAFGVAVGGVLGHEAERVVWTWMGWVAVLGLAMAWIASSLGLGDRGRAAAFAAAFLIPSMPAAATRYHFDLPMLALCWAALAAAMASWGAPRAGQRVVGGALVAVLAFGALMMKWTAAPFLLCMLGAAALAPGRAGWTRRAQGFGVTAVVLGILLAAFLSVTTRSLDSMSTTFTVGGGPDLSASYLPEPIARALRPMATQAPWLPRWLTFYGLSTFFMVLSPAVSLAFAALAAVWLRRDRRGWALFALIGGGGLAFLTLNVPIADCRFILPLMPIPALCAVLGWTTLAPRTRRGVAVAAVVLGLAVAGDFHLRTAPEPRRASPLWSSQLANHGGSVWQRGLGLASSTNDRGWVRRDEELDHRRPFREEIWQAWTHCGPRIGVSMGLLTWGADRYWWNYRASLERTRGAPPDRAWPSVSEVCEMQDPAAHAPPVLFLRAADATDRSLPPCLAARAGTWDWEGFVADPGGGDGAAVWASPAERGCLSP